MSLDSIIVKVQNTEQNLISAINRNNRLLNEISTDGDAHGENLSSLDGQFLNHNGYGQVLLTSAGGTAVKADTTCTVQEDPEHREGWNLTNPVAGQKFNLYYYDGTQETITLGEIVSVYFKGFINRNTEEYSMPFIHIYTKPTGSGDAGAFYHSRIDYKYNGDDTIGIGEESIFYAINEPRTAFNNRKVQLKDKVVNGDGEDSEEVLYVTVSSDSAASQDALNVTLNLLGFNTSSLIRNLTLISESSLTGGATEAKQDVMISDLGNIKTELFAINTSCGSIDDKITVGNDFTLSQAQQVLVYGEVTSGPQAGELHPIHITNSGDVEVEIADFVKGQEPMSSSFPVVISNDQSTLNTKLIGEDYAAVERNIRCDTNGKLIVQVDGVRQSGYEMVVVPNGATQYSTPIPMSSHKYIAFYGDTNNTTNTNIFIEYSQDQVNWFRGAGDNAKIIIVAASGNFYDEEHVTPPFVRIARPNSSGSLETLNLYYTKL